MMTEPAIHVPAARFPEGGEALLEAVPAERGVVQRLAERLDDRERRRRIVVARAQIDDVDSRGEEPPLDGRDLGQRVTRQGLEPRAESNGHRSHAFTGLVRMPTPGISTSTTSPGASGPTPAGVPVATRSPGSRVMTPLM